MFSPFSCIFYHVFVDLLRGFFLKKTFFYMRFLPFDFTNRDLKKQYLISKFFLHYYFVTQMNIFCFFLYIFNRIIYFKFIKGEWSTKLRQRGFLSPLILTLSWILDTWCFIIKRNVHPKVFIYCSGNIFYSYVT